MFESHGIHIQPVERIDLVQMVALRSQPDVWMHLGNIQMISLQEQERWYGEMLSDVTRRYYIVGTQRIDFIGIVRMDAIDVINRSIRVGGDLLPEFQEQGYGLKMIELIKRYCFNFLNVHRIWLLVLDTNERAKGLYRRAGFVDEGRQREAIFRNGKYIDYLMMSMLRGENDCERKVYDSTA